MILLENPIKGFNNILTIATKDMSFGYNTNVNEVVRKITEKPKKQLQTERPTELLESFDTNEITKNTSDLFESQRSSESRPPLKESNLTIFLVSGVLVFGLTKIMTKLSLKLLLVIIKTKCHSVLLKLL